MNQDTETTSPNSRVRDQLSWKLVPVTALTALIVYILVGQLTDLDDFRDALVHARWEWLAASIALMAATLVVQAFRFQIVLKAVGYALSLRHLVGVLLTVWPFVLLAPARVNDLLRAVKLRHEVPAFSCLGSVVAERFVDVQTLCVLGMIGCAAIGAWTWFGVLASLWLVAWSVVVATVINVERLVSLPLLSRFEDKFRGLFHGFEALREKPVYLAGTVAASAVVWLASMANLWLLLWIFDAAMPLIVIVGLWPLALFAGMLPLTIGGMGTRDGAFLALLIWAIDWSGVESTVLAASLGYGLVVVVLPGILGAPLMVRWMLLEE